MITREMHEELLRTEPLRDLRGRLVRVSATQIEKWQGCPRAWAYSRVRPREQSQWMEWGDRMHKLLETWLQFGVLPNIDTPEGAAAFEGLPFLPMPPQSGVEHAFEFVFGGVVYVGRIDLLSCYVPASHVLVTDHKSTGDLKWMEEKRVKLPRDPQWLTYGYYAGEVLDVPRVGGQWIYYRRKPPKAADMTIKMDREELRERFVDQHRRFVLPLAQSRAIMPDGPMIELWIASHPRCENAGSRESYCSKFKGCPYRGECLGGMSPLERGLAAMAA